MYSLRVVTHPEECEAVWRQVMPDQFVTDLWEVRACFHRHFDRPLRFVVAEDRRGIAGLLPLSWVEDHQAFAFFPGETWEGKTWLEQNRVFARTDSALKAMLNYLPNSYHLRYLLPVNETIKREQAVDEVGYHFVPGKYDFDFENYLKEFSGKSAKRLRKELEAFEARGTQFRFDRLSDFDLMVQMNVERYGAGSYFYDPRFRESFRDLMLLMSDRGWLRMTSVIIEGQVAAVDLGCTYNGTYTLLAGGTNAEFPGVAKLINTHHMQYACEQRFERADFLCGNFSWKSLFHLTARPLFLLSNMPVVLPQAEPSVQPEVAPVAGSHAVMPEYTSASRYRRVAGTRSASHAG
jgi:hypothetical protein